MIKLIAMPPEKIGYAILTVLLLYIVVALSVGCTASRVSFSVEDLKVPNITGTVPSVP